MDGARQYILSLTAAALFCVILTGIVGKKGPFSNIMGLLIGVFMAVVLIRPVLDIHIQSPERFLDELHTSAQEAVAMGLETAEEELETGIKERLTAYIQAEAQNLGCDLDVDLSLEENLPQQVTLMGAISPYAKSKLSAWLEKNLQILPEDQVWIG